MKLKKSVIGTMLLVVMLISSLLPSVVLASTLDATGALIRVQQLGLVDSSITDGNVVLTRGQFVTAIAVADGLTETAANLNGSTIFPDIDPNSNLSGYINAVMSKGLMYGMPDGYFHPERGITYAEACTIMVKLLGYTDADVTGMWPYSYINKAYDLKLTRNFSFKRNDNVPVWAAVVMFDKLLDTNIKKTSASAADVTFATAMGLYTECVVYDTAETSTSLAENAVLTDKGTFYLLDPSVKIEAGSTYRFDLDGSTIEKVYGKAKDTINITVDSSVDNIVYYKESGAINSMTLPSEVNYYYHGAKQAYNTLNSILKTNMSVVFVYNTDKNGFAYAVIVDPIYSKPEVAVNFNPTSDKIGNISFDENTSIVKNGEKITKQDIEEFDVVYSVTDVKGNNRSIFVYNSRAEGDIKAFSPNGSNPTSIGIDNGSYGFSKDMDISKVLSFKTGDKVSALLGHDGKVVDLKKIDYKTGTEATIKILGNARTSSELLDNQVKTDLGTYFLLENLDSLEVGGKYTVNVDNDTIVKVKKQENTLDKFGVRTAVNSTVYYTVGEGTSTMILPRISTYYLNGVKTDYNTVLTSLKLGSSIVLAKNNGIYDYGVVVDPIYSEPVINNYANKEIIEELGRSDYMFIYRDGKQYDLINWVQQGDVVYEVSDLWNSNRYLYANTTTVKGYITAIAPNRIDPKSIQIGNTTYSFSKYFDKNNIIDKNIDVDSYGILSLDKDGKVIYIDKR